MQPVTAVGTIGPEIQRWILLVDDEVDNLDLMARAVRGLGSLRTAHNGLEALELLRQHDFAVVVTDHSMPGLTGVELLERAARMSPHTVRILLSGYGDVELLTDAINRGNVSHYLPKPFQPRELRELVKGSLAVGSQGQGVLVLAAAGAADRVAQALRTAGLSAEVRDDLAAGVDPAGITVWKTEVSPPVIERVRRAVRAEEMARRNRTGFGLSEMIGHSPAMHAVFDLIEQVAGTDATVLVRGETGTGKEMVARVLHALSERRDRPFVAVNCAALPEALVESELFGHERGAFTGAQTRKLGRFERADGGTLFIDEVGNMPEAVQIKLLRVLQERAFERVGGTETLHVDLRLVTATNIDLEQAMLTGRFREDLFYRLNVVPLTLAPLRERREDIPLLTEHLLGTFQRRLGKDGIRLSDNMLRRLAAHDWPGNVRELSNVIERVVAMTPSGGVAEVPELKLRAPRQQLDAVTPEPSTASLKELVDAHERRLITSALERHTGNRTVTARSLGITRQGLSIKLKKHGL